MFVKLGGMVVSGDGLLQYLVIGIVNVPCCETQVSDILLFSYYRFVILSLDTRLLSTWTSRNLFT